MDKRYLSILDYIKIPLKYAKPSCLFMILQRVIDGILPSMQLIIITFLLNSLIRNTKNYLHISLTLLLLIITIGYSRLSGQLRKLLEVRLTNNLREKFTVTLIDKLTMLKYRYIDDSNTWDLIYRTVKEPETELIMGLATILNMATLVIQLFGIVIIIVINIWWAGLLILLLYIPLIYLAVKNGKINYQANRDVSYHMREYEYLEMLLIDRDPATERALFEFYDFINKKWQEKYDFTRKLLIRAFLKYFAKIKLCEILVSIITILMIGLLIGSALKGEISLGLLMSITGYMLSLISISSQQLTIYIKNLIKSKEYIRDLNNYMNLDDSNEFILTPSPTTIDIDSIEFKNVSFKYQGSEHYVLKDISFTLRKGKHYAFVGENGAGKTTVIKLITGLYDDFEGDILINGKSIREYSPADIKALCSVAYQDFAKYPISIRDNIAIGDMNNFYVNDDLIRQQLINLKLNNAVNDLPNKEYTVLGKSDSKGIDLSLGQWQKVAIARSLIRKSPLKILDEPTASLDPISESEIYDEYRNMSKSHMTIFISHRLASTKLADEIFVFSEGSIVERGTHKELMKAHGIYYSMFENQRSWYV